MNKYTLGFLAIVLLLGAGCQNINQNNTNTMTDDEVMTVSSEGLSTVNKTNLQNNLNAISKQDLSETEKNGLVFMREEEKLAHDVYLKLYEKFNLPIFNNISQSEKTHTEAVKTLLDRYQITDPTSDEVGVFSDQVLQSLYDELLSESISVESALKAGALVEEVDIVDLEKYLNETDNQDIILVYNNLLKGSRNHLRSFVKNIQRQTGEEYIPQKLEAVYYEEIVGSDIERGKK